MRRLEGVGVATVAIPYQAKNIPGAVGTWSASLLTQLASFASAPYWRTYASLSDTTVNYQLCELQCSSFLTWTGLRFAKRRFVCESRYFKPCP